MRIAAYIFLVATTIVSSAFYLTPVHSDELDQLNVGWQADGRIVVPTNQFLKPAGQQVAFSGRPVDLVLADDGQTLVVKNMRGLVFIERNSLRITQMLKSAGLSAVGLLARNDHIYVTSAENEILVASRQADGTYQWDEPIKVNKPVSRIAASAAADTPSPDQELMIASSEEANQRNKPKVGNAAYPAGMAWISDQQLLVASSRGNSVQRIDLGSGAVVEEVSVGVSPYAISCPRPDRVYVTNWGGDPPAPDATQAISSGTPVSIDARTGVANQGSVSILAAANGKWKQLKTIQVGLHPSGMALSHGGRFVYVANASSDTVSIIDTDSETVVETVACRPAERLPFGSGSNALALSPDGSILYVANGTNNCVAVVRLGQGSVEGSKSMLVKSQLIGLIPTGWYPGALLLTPGDNTLCVANVKGLGSLNEARHRMKGKTTRDYLGSVSFIRLPDETMLRQYTQDVDANNRLAYSLSGLEKARPGAQEIPVPLRHGEPSVFKHVIYVIKENRGYDQVLGDMEQGNGDKTLVMFGEQVTPNQHKLSREFTLFDNFYCSGVLSADGHQWVNESYVTDYLEKAFGKFTRSYPYEGSDPLAFSPVGFLWDNAIAHKKTFLNYGEFVSSRYLQPTTWSDVYADYLNNTHKITIESRPNLETLVPYTKTDYPSFVLSTPDVYRARLFMIDLKKFEQKQTFPDLTYVYLPCDHTSGTRPQMPTPRAAVADNDLALGQIVEAVSKSRFWPDTVIFVVEDDPQAGLDHVDGHRSPALAISAYTRRGYVDHTAYNQTGMVKTIELILGLPAMNQLDLSATPMRNCFQESPNLTPYLATPNLIPLDELNPARTELKGSALKWMKKSLELDLSEADRADEDTLNRILWHSTRGYKTPYPRRFISKREDDESVRDRAFDQ